MTDPLSVSAWILRVLSLEAARPASASVFTYQNSVLFWLGWKGDPFSPVTVTVLVPVATICATTVVLSKIV